MFASHFINQGHAMPFAVKLLFTAICLLWNPVDVNATDSLIEDFKSEPQTRWRFFADTVMGGVSTGSVEFFQEDHGNYARMTGNVSTANNGGFIQIRRDLSAPPPRGAVGLRLIVRGNDQRYFVHLRTSRTVLPWQYYQAGFTVTREWSEVRLPFTDFKPSGWLLGETPDPETLKSVGVVAFGRDHEAEIDVLEVGFYAD
jgi:hypothetical protein